MDVQHGRRAQLAVLVEGFVGREAARADHRPAEVELVEQSLLQAVCDLRERREVLQRLHDGRHIRFGHADLIRGAVDDVVSLREASLWPGGDLVGAAVKFKQQQRRLRQRQFRVGIAGLHLRRIEQFNARDRNAGLYRQDNRLAGAAHALE